MSMSWVWKERVQLQSNMNILRFKALKIRPFYEYAAEKVEQGQLVDGMVISSSTAQFNQTDNVFTRIGEATPNNSSESLKN